MKAGDSSRCGKKVAIKVAIMKGSVRCQSLTLGGSGQNTLQAQEKHGKRLDKTSQKRRVRDVDPFVYRSLNLKDEYDKHTENTRRNTGSKRPILHFIIQFPSQILTPKAPGPFGLADTVDKQKRIMAKQAVDFINETHGGDAVFAARVDRDEMGELIVDVFACPKYEKVTKGRGKNGQKTETWISSTKFGKELAEKHQDEIKRRHPASEKILTGPRHVGIGLQAEFAEFFERKNGVKLTRVVKDDIRPDRLEIEAFKEVSKAREALNVERSEVEIVSKQLEEDRAQLVDDQIALTQARADLAKDHQDVIRVKNKLQKAFDVIVRWLRNPDLTEKARKEAVEIVDASRDLLSLSDDPDDQSPGF